MPGEWYHVHKRLERSMRCVAMGAETVTTVPKQHLSNLHCSHIISWLTSIGVKIYLVSYVQGALASGSPKYYSEWTNFGGLK